MTVMGALARAHRIEQLRNNEIDLQIELTDLAQELEWRVTRLQAVRRLLRDTRRELAGLTEEVA